MAAPPEAFREAVRLFNAGRFFECHEVIEDDLWRPLPPGPEKTFYQGILQVAVGYHHLANGNRVGARSLFERGLAKLQDTPASLAIWLNLAEIRHAVSAWLADNGTPTPPHITLR